MGKWLIAGAVALIIACVVLYLQLGATTVATAAVAPEPQPAAPQTAAVQSQASFAAAVKKAEQEKVADGNKMKLDSDEFFNAFQDVVVQNASRNAMSCYTGGLHTVARNAKVKFTVKDTIKDGVVTISDVTIVPSDTTINDPEMIECMKNEIAKTSWKNERLPDYEEPDMVLIRPEMLVHRWGKEAMSYEGSGPDFSKDHPMKSVH